jgi:hypothetical protein
MNEQLEAASKDDFRWRSLGVAIIACLAILAWVFAHNQAAPGKLRSVPPVPAKQRPTHRATPTGDPVEVCRASFGSAGRLVLV